MKKFFDQMDLQKKGFVTVDDYVSYTKRFPALSKISNSLFNSLDKEGRGKISFQDMLVAMIPKAKVEDINKMISWVNLMYHKDNSQQQ